MATKTQKPTPGRIGVGGKKRFFKRLQFHGNTKPHQISTLLAKRVLRDLRLAMGQEPGNFVHSQWGAP